MKTIAITSALPRTCSASSIFFSPREIETSAPAPMPISMPIAISSVMIGKAIVTAVSAITPTPWPTNTLSMTL